MTSLTTRTATAAPTATPQATDKPERRLDIDLLRVIASVSVVLLHSSGLLLGPAARDPDGGWAHWVALVGDGLGRFAVPAFFAIAGWAVLVASPPRNASVLMRRVLRIVIPLAVWTAVYLVWNLILPDGVDEPLGELAVQSIFSTVRPARSASEIGNQGPVLIIHILAGSMSRLTRRS